MTIKNYIWDQIKSDFKSGIPKPEFKTWLSQASLKEIDQDHAIIEVPNKFVARWLQDNYIDQIQNSFSRKKLKGYDRYYLSHCICIKNLFRVLF